MNFLFLLYLVIELFLRRSKKIETQNERRKKTVEDQFDKSKLNQQKITEGKNTKFFCLC